MMRTRLIPSLLLLVMLTSCGLKRQLELPNHDKFKNNASTQDTTPAVDPDTVPDSDLGEDVVPVKPAKKQ